ncbi:hypothetical protein Raf01_02740 [Rugosimonospora africana]|uniref:Uncharacterized protein n=1 Tax=Rugosimonospora africana TaxID=556532 RepID=A0A8J3VMV4_9ACTN|nr:hypothetical protein Raf01_02740 [Rugosimonospora africana]
MASEDSGPLQARLGSPASYAAELRAAAGLMSAKTPGTGAARLTDWLSLATDLYRRADARGGRLIGYPRLSEYLRLLRPGWWVLRGYVLDVVVFGLSNRMTSVIPLVGGGKWLTGMVVLLGCVVGSVWFGRRAGRWRESWQRYGLRALNLVLGVLLIVVAFQLSDDIRDGWQAANASPVSYQDNEPSDVIPVGSDGRPLSGVRLFDQNGNALNLGDPYSCPSAPATPYLYPMCADPYAAFGVPSWWPGAASLGPSSSAGVQPSTVPSTAVPSITPTPSAGVSATPRPSSATPTASVSG